MGGNHVPRENEHVMSPIRVRTARAPDAESIESIYNEGIAGREATFETEPRQAGDFHERIVSQRYPLLVAEMDGPAGRLGGARPLQRPSGLCGHRREPRSRTPARR
jgi:hypothetical protein